jgi:hypothetical protein
MLLFLARRQSSLAEAFRANDGSTIMRKSSANRSLMRSTTPIAPDRRRAIERMFEAIIRRTSDPSWPRGCLNTNTTLECPNSGDEISRKIAERFGQQETAIYRVLRRAQVENALDPEVDARALAASSWASLRP